MIKNLLLLVAPNSVVIPDVFTVGLRDASVGLAKVLNNCKAYAIKI